MKTMAISVLLGLVALAMAAYIVAFTEGTLFTVDALFTALILLTMGGLFFLNALLELRALRQPALAAAGRGVYGAEAGDVVRAVGTVLDAHFYEASFPHPNKTVVTFAPDGGRGRQPSQLLVFQGNVREQLPAGTRRRIWYRSEPQGNVLLDARPLFFAFLS